MNRDERTEQLNMLAKLDWYDVRLLSSTETLARGFSGIAFAGAIYPTAVSIAFAALMLLTSGFPFGGISLITTFAQIVSFGFVIGGFYAFSCCLLGLPLVACFNASMGFPFSARTQIAVHGGLSGFIATCAVQYEMTQSIPLPEAIVGYGIVALAMAMGQIGAVRTASSPSNWVAFVLDEHPIRLPAEPRRQIQLKQCFVLITWIAAVLGLARLTNYYVLASVTFYVAMQALLLAADAAWVSWRKKRAPLKLPV